MQTCYRPRESRGGIVKMFFHFQREAQYKQSSTRAKLSNSYSQKNEKAKVQAAKRRNK